MKRRNTYRFQLFSYISIVLIIMLFAFSVKGLKKDNRAEISKPETVLKGDKPELNITLDNPYYLEGSDKPVYLYVDLKAPEARSIERRTPLNISLVIDRSGSMNDRNKLDYVKDAVKYIIDELDDEDYLSVISYDDEVNVLYASAPVRSKYLLKDKVANLKAGGYTNLSGGMIEGYDQVKYSYRRGYVNRVMLLSDGIANKGITDVRSLEDIVRDRNRRDGIVISTFGVGNDFNEDLMGSIAEYGRGNYYFISSPESIASIFANELRSVRSLAAQNARVRINIPAYGLKLDKVFGYPYEVSGNDIIIDFKDLFSEETKSVLIKFTPDKYFSKDVRFTASLEYEDVSSENAVRETNTFAKLINTNNKELVERSYDENVKTKTAFFEANEIMQEALREADNGNYTQAKELLKTGRGMIDSQDKNVQASEEVKKQYKSMQGYENELSSAPSMSTEEKSEMQKENKYDNYKRKTGK